MCEYDTIVVQRTQNPTGLSETITQMTRLEMGLDNLNTPVLEGCLPNPC
jgi:hypothetical protein